MILPRFSAHSGDYPSPERGTAYAPQSESIGPLALGPASRLRRRYAYAPAVARRCARSAPEEVGRSFPPASKCGLLAAFVSAEFTRAIRGRKPIILIRSDGLGILAEQRDRT